jgi:hypothetical protein
MILPILLLMTADAPTLEQAQACRAHMELFIEEVAAESDHVAGPTWFIRDWWTRQAIEAGAPDDGGAALRALKSNLEQLRAEAPERFAGGRRRCVEIAIEAGAVPGMGPG